LLELAGNLKVGKHNVMLFFPSNSTHVLPQ